MMRCYHIKRMNAFFTDKNEVCVLRQTNCVLLCKSIKIHLYINVYPEQGLMCVCVLKDP